MHAFADIQQLYDVAVVDPPWAYGSKEASGKPGAAEAQYGTIGSDAGTEVNRRTGAGVENIVQTTPIGSVTKPKSILYLWVTNPKLPFAFTIMEAWGFTYKTMMTWVKTASNGAPLRGGMGWFYRGATEHVLVGTRGGYAIPPAIREPNVFLAQRSGHSVKPDEFYSMVERTSPGQQRLDVYARRRRLGWDVWGDEV